MVELFLCHAQYFFSVDPHEHMMQMFFVSCFAQPLKEIFLSLQLFPLLLSKIVRYLFLWLLIFIISVLASTHNGWILILIFVFFFQIQPRRCVLVFTSDKVCIIIHLLWTLLLFTSFLRQKWSFSFERNRLSFLVWLIIGFSELFLFLRWPYLLASSLR